MDLSVFLLSTPTGLEDFSSIDLASSLLYPLELGVWYLGIWFFLFTFISDRQEIFSLISRNKYQTILKDYASTELAPKKKGNCNVVATWLRHVILLVITSNNIPLSPTVALSIALFLISHFMIHQTPFIYCWESVFLYWIVEKWTSHYSICWEALFPSSYCNFDFYSSTSRLLGLDFFSSWSVWIRITPQSLAIEECLQKWTSLRWRLRWEDVTPLQSISARP